MRQQEHQHYGVVDIRIDMKIGKNNVTYWNKRWAIGLPGLPHVGYKWHGCEMWTYPRCGN